jgi:nicotinate-nucleotide adenylyltransferase
LWHGEEKIYPYEVNMDQQFDMSRPLPGRWGLYGGTFDPIHLGHLYAARQVMNAMELSGVIFMPSGDPPHKSGKVRTPARQRLEMVRLAIADQPGFYYTDYEMVRPGPSYSYLTLEALKASLPEATSMVFIIGGDSLAEMPRWRCPERILAAMEVAVAYRPGTSVALMEAARTKLGADRITMVYCPGMEVSSTGVRRGDLSQVPSAVESYIVQRRLYGYDQGRAACLSFAAPEEIPPQAQSGGGDGGTGDGGIVRGGPRAGGPGGPHP